MNDVSAPPMPFVDFYREHSISPVSQDISDLQRHYGRRESLYRLLGILPSFVRGIDVIELCPGSGYNSLYTQSLEPAGYCLVDGNKIGLDVSRQLFKQYHPDAHNVTFEQAYIHEFEAKKQFDLVLCEGSIPLQLEPKSFARDLCRFVKTRGLIVVTCADAVSLMGECTRRLIASKISPVDELPHRRLEALRPIFAPHLESLVGASRPIDDWIFDNILQPFVGMPFSISDAIEVYGSEGFEFYGSSPDITVDWRWYKDLTPGMTHWNERMLEAYASHTLNFLDCRFLRQPHSVAFGATLNDLCLTFFTRLRNFETKQYATSAPVVETLRAIVAHVAASAPETATSLKQAADFMGAPELSLESFTSFFGRGQQYLSFIAP